MIPGQWDLPITENAKTTWSILLPITLASTTGYSAKVEIRASDDPASTLLLALAAELNGWEATRERLVVQLETQVEIGRVLGREVEPRIKQLTAQLEEVRVAVAFLQGQLESAAAPASTA